MKVNGERIKQAREIRGMTQAQLSERVGVSQPHISAVEQNGESPSAELLEGIALATGFLKNFFLRPTGPDFPLGSLLYRKKRKLGSVEAASLRQMARAAIEVVAYLERLFRPIACMIPRANSSPSEAAQLARSFLGVSPDGPIVGLIRKLEKSGVLVVLLPGSSEEFDAFSAWSAERERRPVICLSPVGSGDRLRRTVAHELGHLMIHQDILGADNMLERQANLFAGELLFPEIAMREELVPPLTLTRLAELKKRWGVSMSAIAYDAAVRGIISDRQKGYIRAKMSECGWLENEPVPVQREYPRLICKMADSAFPLGDAARVISRDTGLSLAFVETLLAANRSPQESKAGGSLRSHTDQGPSPEDRALNAEVDKPDKLCVNNLLEFPSRFS